MPIPDYQSFYRPLLEFAADGQEHVFKHAVEHIAQRFKLTTDDRQVLLPSRAQPVLENRVGWAKTYLVKAGLLEAPRRGVFRVTERGRQAVATPEPINNRFLRQFPEFLAFVAPRGDEQQEEAARSEQAGATETTPEELIESGYRQLHRALRLGVARTSASVFAWILRAVGGGTPCGDGLRGIVR